MKRSIEWFAVVGLIVLMAFAFGLTVGIIISPHKNIFSVGGSTENRPIDK